MAGNRVTSILEIVTKGAKEAISSFRQIASSTNDASTATNRATTANDNYHRGAKALYQTNLAQGRAISKLKNEIGGSSGLVAAYATLAVNLYAASAAISTLSNAAQLEQLQKSLTFVGNAAGSNLGLLVDKLKEVTEGALSTEEAFRSAALGVSAGFNTEQLSNLSRVAKGASLALGRDMSDAMDRLTRGAAKLEPEILDELGIIVRLDTATADYAAQVGKTVDQLTQYERTQAFVNAINEQGAKKFGAVADSIEVNPYNKLVAALSNLKTLVLDGINAFVKFTGVLDFLSNSTGALLGSVILLGATFAKQLLPSLAAMPMAVAAFASKMEKSSKLKLSADFSSFTKLPPVLDKLKSKFIDGTATSDDFKRGLDSSQKSINRNKDILEQYKNTIATTSKEKKELAQKIKASQERLEQATIAQRSMIEAQQASARATATASVANGLQAASLGNLREGFTLLREGFKQNSAAIAQANKGASAGRVILNGLSQAAFVAGNSIRFLGTALLTALPYIGIILMLLPLIAAGWKKLFPPSVAEQIRERVTETMKSIKEEFAKFAEFSSQFELSFGEAKDADKLIGAYKALAGIASTVAEQVTKGVNSATSATIASMIEQKQKIKEIQDELGKIVVFTVPQNVLEPILVNAVQDTKDITEKLKEPQKELENLKKQLESTRKAAAIGALDEAIFSLSSLESLKGASSDIAIFQAKLEEIQSNKDLTSVEVVIEVDKAAKQIKSLLGAVEDIPKALQEIQKAQNDIFQKTSTPLDDLISKYKSLTNAMNKSKEEGGNIVRVAIKNNLADIIAVTQLFKEPLLPDVDNIISAVEEYQKKLEDARSAMIGITLAAKGLQDITKEISSIASNYTSVLQTQLQLENLSIELQIEGLKRQREAAQTLQDRLSLTLQIANLEKGRIGIDEQKIKLSLNNLDYEKKLLDTAQKLADLEVQRLKTQQAINSIYSLSNNAISNGLELIYAETKAKDEQDKKESDLAKRRIQYEQAIATFRLDAIRKYQLEEIAAYTAIEQRRKQLLEDRARVAATVAELGENITKDNFQNKIPDMIKELVSSDVADSLLKILGIQQKMNVEAEASSQQTANIVDSVVAVAKNAAESVKAAFNVIEDNPASLQQIEELKARLKEAQAEVVKLSEVINNISAQASVKVDTKEADTLVQNFIAQERQPIKLKVQIEDLKNIPVVISSTNISMKSITLNAELNVEKAQNTLNTFISNVDNKTINLEVKTIQTIKLATPEELANTVIKLPVSLDFSTAIGQLNNFIIQSSLRTISIAAQITQLPIDTSLTSKPIELGVELKLDAAKEALAKFISEASSTTIDIGVTATRAASTSTVTPTVSPVVPVTATASSYGSTEAPRERMTMEQVKALVDNRVSQFIERETTSTGTQALELTGVKLEEAKDILVGILANMDRELAQSFDVSPVLEPLTRAFIDTQAGYDQINIDAARQIDLIDKQAQAADQKLVTDKASQIVALATVKAETDYLRILDAGAQTNSALLKIQIARNNAIAQQAILDTQSKKLNEEKAMANAKNDADRIAAQENINALSALESSIRMSKISAEEEIFQLNKLNLDIQEKINNLSVEERDTSLEIYKNNLAIENLRKGKGTDLTVAQQLDVVEKEYSNTVERINLETDLAKSRLAVEKDINSARLQVIQAELESMAKKVEKDEPTRAAALRGDAGKIASLNEGLKSGLAEQVSLLDRAAQQQRDAAAARLDSQKISIVSQNTPKLPEMENMGAIKLPPIDFTTMLNGFASARQQAKDTARSIERELEETKKLGLELGMSEDEAVANATKKSNIQGFAANITKQAQLATAGMGPFIEQLKALGPEGQYVSAIAQGGIKIASSLSTIAESMATLGDKTAGYTAKMEGLSGVLSSLSNVIGSIGAIQQAASGQRIAEIDKEIAAERKRDGKSKESLAKIAGLEKKKEQEKKKAFEQNKKMMMAQTIISTAAAIAGALATQPVGPWNIAQAALFAALGAAQLAVISGTSYQGGGGSAGSSVPSSISVGERSNKVDVAQRPTGGELAYIQGERGMGTNANNFRPAFMGARYRATGGYVVGEQGPELFIPDAPGRIVPNDEMMQPGAPINVNFTVSAIDATSFNDMLADQRGNIISLIREAANSYGQPFLEGVNTITMAPAQRNYYRKA